MNKIELLSPAGSFEALIAAVQNGADAIYLGGKEFSARAYASNFDRNQIEEAVAYAHVRGVKIYVTINTLVKDREIDALLDYVEFLYNADIDAIIVQDLGVLNIIRKIFPKLEVHASTQMNINNVETVRYLQQQGVKRVVLSRELSLKEIKEIHKATSMPIEVFVHGALCVSYSGQCLLSSFIGGRSGNRGKCAQPCRKKYQLISNKGQKQDQSKYLISLRDLNTLENIEQLIDSGITSFKIEGRMKKPQYVAAVVSAYRKAIDAHLKNGDHFKDDKTQNELKQVFNRKFTKGYILNSAKEEIINIEKPNNHGLFLGQVDYYNKRKNCIGITLKEDIAQGDGIEICGKTKDVRITVQKLFDNGRLTHEAFRGNQIEIEINDAANVGDLVYKTYDKRLDKSLEKSYSGGLENKKIGIYGDIKVEKNKYMTLSIWDNDGNSIIANSEFIVEQAIKSPIDKSRILDNLNKLGNTPFYFKHIQVSLDHDVVVPLSSINRVRREAIIALIEKRKIINHRDQIIKIDPWKWDNKMNNYLLTKSEFKLYVKVNNLEKLKEVLTHNIDRIYYEDINTLTEAINLCDMNDVPVYLKTSNVVKNIDFTKLNKPLQNKGLTGVLVGDLGMLEYISKHFGNLDIVPDISLNVFNSYGIDQLQKKGIKKIAISPEIDIKSIKQLKLANHMELEVIAYGKLPVMTMEYCPIKSTGKCSGECQFCQQFNYRYKWALKDEKKIHFPLTHDTFGRTIIYNSHPIFMADRLKDLNHTAITALRIEISDESIVQVSEILEMFKCKRMIDPQHIKKMVGEFTRGYYYKDID
ncbi:DUF3656 domain-containing protein [Serpentinicella sp. ANB-PHB4]|uniref:DUF3656 domain-containing U32 family peptidase n=1 Tax=Serpentinicella sp. ANB-PHB4 TaxID=3074076 RepID=UPI00285452C8|nr:DUF3656 domain-containing protein [Serpentinicella sp. ANB-PHB4]MDR5659598.1 DUF3656 domain-containing protein [Serpentinicella sp. ANB-PHB4]